jgi:hypothetical protein
MIRTHDHGASQAAARFFYEKRASVTACVVEGLEFAFLVSKDQHLLGAEIEDAKAFWTFKLIGSADVDPVAIPDPLQILLMESSIQIGFTRKGGFRLRESVVLPDLFFCVRHSEFRPEGDGESRMEGPVLLTGFDAFGPEQDNE